jgi:hypothetical protein
MRHRHYTEMNEKMPSSVIKLNITSSKVREIYDLDYLELDNSSTSSACSSGYSSSPESLKNFDSNSLINSLNSTPRSSFTYQNSLNNNSSSAKSSTQQQHHHNYHHHHHHKLNHYQQQQQNEQFSFQDFISSIVNSDDKDSQILIVQDIARLLELKYREFKKFIENSQQQNHNNSSRSNLNTHQAIYLNTESDLFTKIAESIFKMASEEPNGILGSKIKLRLMYESGNVIDMCPFFAYDTDTLATSEITVTLKECSTDLKKFFKAFRLFNNFVRYFPLNIHSSSFDINKRKLY